MKKKGFFSKFYTIAVVLVCMLAMTSTAFGAFSTTNFSGNITHTTGTYRTGTQTKTNSSAGYIFYSSGSSSYIRVEMWGAPRAGTYGINLTKTHTEGSDSSAKYYYVNKGEMCSLFNTVYSYYGGTANSSLLITGYAAGNVSGKWAADSDTY